MADRWSIFIDIEGFSALWENEDQVLWSLGELMRAIFRIGRLCYPREPDRLFAHQLGDGFLIVSDFHEESLDRCVAIAVALMRHVAHSGRLAKCSISEGELSDIQGCYPEEVLDCREADHTVSLGMGRMTIFPTMGTALIRSVLVDKIAPRGPLLTMDSSKRERLGPSIPCLAQPELISVDWVHMESANLEAVQQRASLSSPSPIDLEMLLQRYCAEQAVSDDWVENVYGLLGVPRPSDDA